MFYTDEEISVITGFLNGYLVRDHASAKVRESYIRISAGLQSHTLTRDDYVWLENALLFLRPYWWSDREDGENADGCVPAYANISKRRIAKKMKDVPADTPFIFFSVYLRFAPSRFCRGHVHADISAGHDRPSRACAAPSSMPNDLKYKVIVAESCRGVQVENASSPREPAYPFISSYP